MREGEGEREEGKEVRTRMALFLSVLGWVGWQWSHCDLCTLSVGNCPIRELPKGLPLFCLLCQWKGEGEPYLCNKASPKKLVAYNYLLFISMLSL